MKQAACRPTARIVLCESTRGGVRDRRSLTPWKAIMNKILVGLDGSTRSPHVLDPAVETSPSGPERLSIFYRAVGLPSELPVIALSMSPGDPSASRSELGMQATEMVA